MDRRKFLTGLFGVTSAAAALAISGGKAEAASLLEKATVADNCSDASAQAEAATENAADLPAEQAAEAQFYYAPRRRVVRRRMVRRPIMRRRIVRQRCWYARDRFGRLVRRCGYV